MDVEQLIEQYPVCYHMAEDGVWPSIEQHGLLSTTALVDLFNPPDDQRADILRTVRRRTITIEHPDLGIARIRDQGPLKFMDRVLTDDTTPQEFLDALNGRVFFWLTRARLDRLLAAKRYRRQRQTVLHVETRGLVAERIDTVELAPYNTGSMHVPTAPRRGKSVFQPVADYPFDDWRRRRGRREDPVVELTVRHSVPNIRDYVLRVETWHEGTLEQTLFTR